MIHFTVTAQLRFVRRPQALLLALATFACLFTASLRTATAYEFTLQGATIADIQQAFDGGFTSEQLVQMYLNRIAAYDDAGPGLNAVLSVNPRALDEARALDAERWLTGPRGPLHGVPVLLKDNLQYAPLPTTAGSAALADSQPLADAFVVRRLIDAGAIVLGKTNLDELAITGAGYSSIAGVIRNPYRPTRTSGGSSGGTGAAVAANFATFGLGTDTGGSIRTPCSFQGLACIRPTRGLVSIDGVVPFTPTRDAVGPMARTVADAAAALGVLAGYDPHNPTFTTAVPAPAVQFDQFHSDYTQFLDAHALNGARLGVITNFLGEANGVDPGITQSTLAAIAAMRARGADIIDVTLDDDFLSAVAATYRAERLYEQKQYLDAYLSGLGPSQPHSITELQQRLASPSIADSETPSIIMPSLELANSADRTEIDAAYAENAVATTSTLRQSLIDTLDSLQLDALIFPTVNIYASPAFGEEDPTYTAYRLTAPVRPVELASSLGLPDITVPIGLDPWGLPATLSMTGRPYSEPTLVGLAFSLEQATLAGSTPSYTPSLPGESVPEPALALGFLWVSMMGVMMSLRR